MASIALSIDFNGALVVATPTVSFASGGFLFTADDPMQTTTDTNVQGLSFSARGVEIALPVRVNTVVLKVIGGASQMRLRAFDASGILLDDQLAAAGHVLGTVRLAGEGIAKVIVDEGSNEGLLVLVSIDVDLA